MMRSCVQFTKAALIFKMGTKHRKYSKEELEFLVKSSTSLRQVILKLGLKYTGGNCNSIKNKINLFGINCFHFTGKSWKKGLSKKTSDMVLNNANSLKNSYMTGKIINPNKGKKSSIETRKKISIARSKNNNGGRCKFYVFKNVKLQGKWERDLAIQMSKLGIEWEKITLKSFKYKYIDEYEKVYIPDFIIEKTFILEVKGIWWPETIRKMKLVKNHNDISSLRIVDYTSYKDLISKDNKNDFLLLLNELTYDKISELN